jgi:ABC-type transport system involved in cytochrome c biogenesis permease subunit
MNRLVVFLGLLLSGLSSASQPTITLPSSIATMDLSRAEGIAVLTGGRVKPLLVAAQEGVQGIRGRASLNADYSPMHSWFALTLFSDTLSRQKIILCEFRPLRKALGLPEEGRWESFQDLASSAKLRNLIEVAAEKDRRKERLTKTEKAAREVGGRLQRFQVAGSGADWRLIPGPKGDEGTWRLPQEVSPNEVLQDTVLLSRMGALRSMLMSFAAGDQSGFDAAASRLAQNEILHESYTRRAIGEPLRIHDWQISAELFLVTQRPFRWTWILLLVSFLAAYVAQTISRKGVVASEASRILAGLTTVSASLAGASILAMAVGFALRVLVSGRAPVTNMYETTLWVGFGSVLFGLIFAALYRSRIVLASVAAAGAIVFLLADSVPSVLSPAIAPLTPVLRSNYWLTLHVLTVTISYAAFLVAMALGNLGLFQVFRRGSEAFQKELAHYTYRAIQLGVLLLTAGIILGGVWADYSWGRFWGWDPKETWSLIADLGYLIILHGRFTGWVKSFGTLLGGVLAFYGVVMAWYGVNFILASGLHSYGFSEGGATAMAAYALLQGAFAGACVWKRRRQIPSEA